MRVISQKKYIPCGAGRPKTNCTTPYSVGLDAEAFAYVPAGCAADVLKCRVHVAYHGCGVQKELMGAGWARHVGLTQWAESNRIVLLFPQTQSTDLEGPGNTDSHDGCWDWTGQLTGADFDTLSGPQIATVIAVLADLQNALFGPGSRVAELDLDAPPPAAAAFGHSGGEFLSEFRARKFQRAAKKPAAAAAAAAATCTCPQCSPGSSSQGCCDSSGCCCASDEKQDEKQLLVGSKTDDLAAAAPSVEIAPGVRMPMVALGTGSGQKGNVSDAVATWLDPQVGGVAIDTAHDYDDQAFVAAGVKAAGAARSAVFLETKLPCTNGAKAQANFDANMKALGVARVDLTLIHSPDGVTADEVATWKVLEKALAAGKTRAIGVSHFVQKDFENLIAGGATVVPAVNQVHDDDIYRVNSLSKSQLFIY